jgi:hypothetical protein
MTIALPDKAMRGPRCRVNGMTVPSATFTGAENVAPLSLDALK